MRNVPDVLVAAKDVYRLLFENDSIRVMEIELMPGEKALMHNHPHAHLVYVKSTSRLKLTTPEGKERVIDQKAGQTMWVEGGPHEGENIGDTDMDNVVIEVKR
jgi:oxalate decarboxylase/phosphoglucose isomerase-like protein (cupin superfamily)